MDVTISPAATINFMGEFFTGKESYGTPLVGCRYATNEQTNGQTDRQMNIAVA